MKITITIEQLMKTGDISVYIHRHQGMGTDLETAYCHALTEVVKMAIPTIGKSLGGKLDTPPDKQN